MKTMFALVSALLLIGPMAGSALGQDPAMQKPYQQWTYEEVQKLLTDSPWAQSRDKGVVIGYDNPVVNGTNLPPPPETVILRLRSALPIRQALARLRQLRAKYDKMNAAEKKALDEKNKVLLDCPACADNYVVVLAGGGANGKGLPTILQTISQAEIKANVRIVNELGETRELVHFVAPKSQADEAVFFFARFDDKGQPLIGPGNRKLLVSFDPKLLNTSPITLIKFEFEVSKMLLNGGVAF